MAEIEHLSASSIGCYMRCPKQFYFRYVEDIKTPTWIELLFGSAIHDAIESALTVRKGIKTLKSWPAFLDERIDSTPDIDWGGAVYERIKATGAKMLAVVQPTIEELYPQVEAVEKFFNYKIEGIDIPIIGYIDILLKDKTVIDIKTAARRWNVTRVNEEIQPLIYAMAINGNMPEFKYIIITKTAKPVVQILSLKPSRQQLRWMREQIRDVWHGIQAEAFHCGAPGWWCDARYCGYWRLCKGKEE